MPQGDKSHDTKITSQGQVKTAVRQSSLGGARQPEPQFGITKVPVFNITHTMRKTARNP